MNKTGIELAANFIIILIISIIMLGLAGGITYKVFCASGEKIAQLDDTTSKFIEQKLNSGASVQIPQAVQNAQHSAAFCGSSSVDAAAFSIGVRNDDSLSAHDYAVDCAYKGVEVDGELTGTPSDCTDWNFQASDFHNVLPKDKKTGLLVLTVPQSAEVGTHKFTISVHTGGTTYGVVNIYVQIK